MALLDLVTNAEMLAAWPKFSALPSDEQASLITDASRRFESECDRIIGATAYTEVHRPGRTRKLYLKQKPVTTITRVATDYATVITVQNTDATVSRATIGFSGPTVPEAALSFTGVTLNAIANGVAATPVTLLFATYPTLGTLVAAINLLPGWNASVASGGQTLNSADYTTFATADLATDVGQQGCNLLGAELKAYTRDLDYACDAELARRGIVELMEGLPDGYRYPDRRNGGYASGFTGLTGVSGGMDPRIGGVFASYQSGYATADVPGDIKRAVKGIVRFFYASMVATGVYESEQFKDYNYKLVAKLDLPHWIQTIAYNHSRKEIV